MIRVEKIPPEQPEETYNIIGLTRKDAEILRAVVGAMAGDVRLTDLFCALPRSSWYVEFSSYGLVLRQL